MRLHPGKLYVSHYITLISHRTTDIDKACELMLYAFAIPWAIIGIACNRPNMLQAAHQVTDETT